MKLTRKEYEKVKEQRHYMIECLDTITGNTAYDIASGDDDVLHDLIMNSGNKGVDVSKIYSSIYGNLELDLEDVFIEMLKEQGIEKDETETRQFISKLLFDNKRIEFYFEQDFKAKFLSCVQNVVSLWFQEIFRHFSEDLEFQESRKK